MTRGEAHQRCAPAVAEKHAEALYAYGAPLLDGFHLRCWIVQRLMLDCGLDHAAAEQVWARLPRRLPLGTARSPGRHRRPRLHRTAHRR
jgi:hypothetical protein